MFATDEDGYIDYDEDWKVSGDDLYTNSSGRYQLPIGTITIQETKPPTGYLVNDEIKVVHFTLQADGTVRSDLDTWNTTNECYDLSYTSDEQVKRGDFDFTKKTEDGRTLSNIPFTITSPTGEVHTVVTDENGYYSTASSYISHGANTNAGVAGAGVWFGELSELNDNYGALYYGTYTVKEKPCKNKYVDTVVQKS